MKNMLKVCFNLMLEKNSIDKVFFAKIIKLLSFLYISFLLKWG